MNWFSPFVFVFFVAWFVFDPSASRTYAVALPVKNGQLRVVLTWGETPRDLDSHLDTPSGCHVYYGRKQCRGEASLDTDVTDSYGPETINIVKLLPGVYKYSLPHLAGCVIILLLTLWVDTRCMLTPPALSSNPKRLFLCTESARMPSRFMLAGTARWQLSQLLFLTLAAS